MIRSRSAVVSLQCRVALQGAKVSVNSSVIRVEVGQGDPTAIWQYRDEIVGVVRMSYPQVKHFVMVHQGQIIRATTVAGILKTAELKRRAALRTLNRSLQNP